MDDKDKKFIAAMRIFTVIGILVLAGLLLKIAGVF